LYQIFFQEEKLPKKGKEQEQCKSKHAIIASQVLSQLMELLRINDVNSLCSTPDSYFGLEVSLISKHVHCLAAHLLISNDEKAKEVYICCKRT